MAKGSEKFEIAKRAVVQVGGGRGFIVSAGEDRYVITAAHCLPSDKIPTPHLANSDSELTFPKIIGRLVSKRLTIWAELCAYSLTDDIAALSETNGQELGMYSKRYLKFPKAAMMVGKSPDVADSYNLKPTPGMAAWVLSLSGEWKGCIVHTSTGRFLSITSGDQGIFESGMSGSPIINASGAAISLISTGSATSNLNPILMDCLPPWLLRKLDVDG
jgi:hypothetical protein